MNKRVKKNISAILIGLSLVPVGGVFANEVQEYIEPELRAISQIFTGKRYIHSAQKTFTGMRTFTVSASSPNFKIFVNEYHAGPNNDIPMMSAITTNKNEKFGARGYEYYIRYEGLSEYAKATGSIK